MVLAYIDPGAGSLIVQGLLATILAIPFFFRSRVSAVLARIRRKPTDRHQSEGD